MNSAEALVFRSLFLLSTAQSLMEAYFGSEGWGFESLRARHNQSLGVDTTIPDAYVFPIGESLWRGPRNK
jgi:hypothetical protein